MTKETWTGEGVASGTPVTAANSDDGTPSQGLAFAVSIDATNIPVTYDNTRAKFGTQSVKFSHVNTVAASSYLQRTLVDGASARGKARQYWYFTGNPSGNVQLVKFLSSTGAAAGVGRIDITSTGKIAVYNTAGGQIPESVSANSIPLNAWWMLDAASAPGVTTTTGAMDVKGVNAAGATFYEYNGTGLNLGTTPNVQYVRIGRIGDAVQSDIWMDSPSTDSGAGYIGAADVTPPTGTAVERDDVKEIDVTSWLPGSGGLPMAYGLTLVSGPAVTFREVKEGFFSVDKHTTGLPSVVRVTGTDAGGGIKTADYTIPVATSGVSYAPFIWADGLWK